MSTTNKTSHHEVDHAHRSKYGAELLALWASLMGEVERLGMSVGLAGTDNIYSPFKWLSIWGYQADTPNTAHPTHAMHGALLVA